MPGNPAPSRLPPGISHWSHPRARQRVQDPQTLQALGDYALLSWLWDELKQRTDSLVAPELMALNSLVTEWATKKSP